MTFFVGLTGEAGAGKDVTGGILAKLSVLKSTHIPHIVSFAAPVYALAEALAGESLSDRSSKEIPRMFHIKPENLEKMKEVYDKYELFRYMSFPDAWDEFFNKIEKYVGYSWKEECLFCLILSPRQLLELVGTELGRDILSKTVWLDTLERVVNRDQETNIAIVTDLRFDNEAEFIKKIGGIVVKVDCPNNSHATKSDHVSAKGINPILVDHTIVNKKEGLWEYTQQLSDFYNQFIKGKH